MSGQGRWAPPWWRLSPAWARSDTPSTLLVTTAASPADVAARLHTRLETTTQITEIQSTRRIVGSSLSAVDFATLTRVGLGFALALIGATAGCSSCSGSPSSNAPSPSVVPVRGRDLPQLELGADGTVLKAGLVPWV